MLTRAGWTVAGIAAGMLVAGRLLGAVELYVLGGVAGALLLLSALWTGLARLRVDVTRQLHPPRVHAGSPSRVDLRVENLGRRRSPVLGLLDAVSGTRGAQLAVGPLGPGDTASAAYRLPTERRGILRVGPLEVVMADAFGLTRLTLPATGVTELTVYPHVDEVPPIPLAGGDDPMAGAEHPDVLRRSGDDFYALRPYVVGDDLRRVHWPSTARHDDLMVRQDELPWQGRATVLLDLRTTTTDPDGLELAISAAASLVTASARRQDLIRLVTSDGSDSGFAAGHAHIESILEHLAAVEASHELTWPRVLDRLARGHTGGALVAVVGHPPEGDLAALGRLRRRYGTLTVVQVDRSAWDPTAPAGAAPSVPGAVRIEAGRPFPQAWAAHVGRRGGRVRPTPQPGRAPRPDAEPDAWERRSRSRA